jgi:hypothetical protein
MAVLKERHACPLELHELALTALEGFERECSRTSIEVRDAFHTHGFMPAGCIATRASSGFGVRPQRESACLARCLAGLLPLGSMRKTPDALTEAALAADRMSS